MRPDSKSCGPFSRPHQKGQPSGGSVRQSRARGRGCKNYRQGRREVSPARARVFDSEEDSLQGILGGKVKSGDVVVIRYEGPKGRPRHARDVESDRRHHRQGSWGAKSR